MSKKLWIYASGFFAGVGMLLVGLVTQTQAQWGSSTYISLNRSQIAHSLHNEGMSGKKDNRSKLAQASFGYPMGRSLKVYSGGSEREGWNAKSNSAGEGFWILSNTGGTPHGSYAGSRMLSSDVVPREHDMTKMPEAYLGTIENGEWALAMRSNSGSRLAWTEGGNMAGVSTNWWPEAHGIPSPSPGSNKAVVVWNFRFGRYNTNETYTSRIASGDLPQYDAPAWAEALSEDDFPEQIGIQEGASTATGLEWTRKWFCSGSNDYDHFIIVDNLLENKSSATVENIYIAFQNRIMSGQSTNWHGTSWNAANDWAEDDYTRFTLASNYLDGLGRDAFVAGAGKPAGLQRGVDLANAGHPIVYVHDGESDNIQSLWPDVGDPYKYAYAYERYTREQTWVRENMMQHSQYFGLGTVDAFPPFMRYGGADDETYVAPHDNPATAIDESVQQPASVLVHQYRSRDDFDYPSPDRDSDAFIYDAVANGGYADDNVDPQMSTQIVAYGPYTLAPGEKAKVVIVYVVGTAAQHAKYADYKKYPQPFTMGFNNLYGGRGSAPVKFEDRQKDIPLGEDVLFDNFEHAIDMYEWGYDIPNQPTNVKIAHDSNLQGKTQIRWSSFGEDSTDPDYTGAEAQDLRGYRIYRTSLEYQCDWEFIAEFSFEDAAAGNLPAGVNYDPAGVWSNVKSGSWPQGVPLHTNKYLPATEAVASSPTIPGMYTFDDPNTNAGFPNWYSVRLYDSGHADFNGTGTSVRVLESSHSPELGGMTGRLRGIVPVVPGAAVFDALEEQVRVVPNPFKADDDLHTYSRQQNMRFINLPGRCRIDIYDVTGQRTWTMFNNDPLKAELTYIQLAENRPSNFGEAMFPGIYFWKVVSYMPGQEGKTQSGTFAIIK